MTGLRNKMGITTSLQSERLQVFKGMSFLSWNTRSNSKRGGILKVSMSEPRRRELDRGEENASLEKLFDLEF